MSAPDFAVCADYSNCADGLWENHSSELVSEQTVEGRTGGAGTLSIYSDNLPIFWKSVQQAFAFAGLDFLDGCECPDDVASADSS